MICRVTHCLIQIKTVCIRHYNCAWRAKDQILYVFGCRSIFDTQCTNQLSGVIYNYIYQYISIIFKAYQNRLKVYIKNHYNLIKSKIIKFIIYHIFQYHKVFTYICIQIYFHRQLVQAQSKVHEFDMSLHSVPIYQVGLTAIVASQSLKNRCQICFFSV